MDLRKYQQIKPKRGKPRPIGTARPTLTRQGKLTGRKGRKEDRMKLYFRGVVRYNNLTLYAYVTKRFPGPKQAEEEAYKWINDWIESGKEKIDFKVGIEPCR